MNLAGYVMLGLGVVIILALVLILWQAQRDDKSPVDLTDMLIDQSVGKITQGRFWSLVGGAAATWVFVYLPVSGHFDPTYASIYITVVFAFKVANDITSKPAAPVQTEGKPDPNYHG